MMARETTWHQSRGRLAITVGLVGTGLMLVRCVLEHRRRGVQGPSEGVPHRPVSDVLTYGPLCVGVAAQHPGDLEEFARLLRPAVQRVDLGAGTGGTHMEARGGRFDASVWLARPDGPTDRLEATLDGHLLAGERIPQVTRNLLSRLDLMVLEHERDFAHLHAGLVIVAGQGIVIPAVSGAGKSNLVAALAADGVLCTDELVTVDHSLGRLRAAYRPITLKLSSRERGRRLAPQEPAPTDDDPWLLPADAIGAGIASEVVPALIVVPDRTAGIDPPRRLMPAETLEVLIANTYDVDVSPVARLADLAWLAASVPAWRVPYAEAAEAVSLIHEILTRGDRGGVSWSMVPPATGNVAARRHPDVLGVVVGDGAILWHPKAKTVLRLDGAGAAVWEFLDGEQPIPESVEGFVADLTSHGMIAIPGGPVEVGRVDADLS